MGHSGVARGWIVVAVGRPAERLGVPWGLLSKVDMTELCSQKLAWGYWEVGSKWWSLGRWGMGLGAWLLLLCEVHLRLFPGGASGDWDPLRHVSTQ